MVWHVSVDFPSMARKMMSQLVSWVAAELVRLRGSVESFSARVHFGVVGRVTVVGVPSANMLRVVLLEVVLLPGSADSIAGETVRGLILVLFREQAFEVAVIRRTGSLDPRAFLLGLRHSFSDRLALHRVLREHAVRVEELAQVRHVSVRHVEVHGGALVVLIVMH